jgi:hypothetical protein
MLRDLHAGPVAWDLAASTASQRLDGPRILAAYGTPVDVGQLAVCQQLRRLHLTAWYALYAERLPECRPRAAELLALWPVPRGRHRRDHKHHGSFGKSKELSRTDGGRRRSGLAGCRGRCLPRWRTFSPGAPDSGPP